MGHSLRSRVKRLNVTTVTALVTVVVTLVPALGAAPPVSGQSVRNPDATVDGHPSRVLITNDNGIDDPKIAALARAFAERSEVWVVAPAEDRSGTGSFMSMMATGGLDVVPRDLGPGIRAFAVDGFPADCVMVAMLGIMRDSLPDLIVSGINGGVNAGSDWMFSGTVGAARVAAFGGVPAIAVSGLDDDIPGAVEHAVDWVVRFAASSAVRGLAPHEYLTVSLPRSAPGDIRGVTVADRAPVRLVPRLEEAAPGRWAIVGVDELSGGPPSGSDEVALSNGYAVVVPMRVDEVDGRRLLRWLRTGVALPDWRAPGE